MARILTRTTSFLAMTGLVLLVFAGTAPAAMMNYGTFMADNVTFGDVTEDNLAPNLFYDMFQVAGDTLIFDPDGFGVQVDPGPGVDFVDSELEMLITAKDGRRIEAISVTEQGDYTIVNDGQVDASAPFFWQIIEVDGQGIAPISGSGTVNFSSTTDVTGAVWDLGFTVDLVSELANAEADRGQDLGDLVTKANFRFDNTLTAQAPDALSVAFIKKKQLGGVQIAVTVPEPSSLLPVLLGLTGLAMGYRRK